MRYMKLSERIKMKKLLPVCLSIFALISTANASSSHMLVHSTTYSDVCVSDPEFDTSSDVCVDSQDQKSYSVAPLEMTCVLNPSYQGDIPQNARNYCNGNPHSYSDMGPGYDTSLGVSMPGDQPNTQMAFLTDLQFSFGKCSQHLQANDLSSLAGNIYTCDQTTGQFVIHKR